jgi:RND family efflux transporter MFP subunit
MERHSSKHAACMALLCVLTGSILTAQAEELPGLDCVINPHKIFDLGTGVPGVIHKINVERSDYVEAEQVVAELDTEVERASVAVAKARAEISSELALGQLNVAFDMRRKERIADLYKAKSVSIQSKEDAELEAELSLRRLDEAHEQENIRALELWRAQARLEQKIVRSPFSGYVLKKFKSEGEYIEDQPIVRIAQLDKLNVEVIAPMDLFGKIKVGMVADVYPESFAGGPRRAEVSVVDRMGDIASGTFGVRLSLANEDYAIPAGLKCTLKFDQAQPAAAIANSSSPEQVETREQHSVPLVSADNPLQPLWTMLQPSAISYPGLPAPALELLIQYITPVTGAFAPG